jgi:hypothetical protein
MAKVEMRRGTVTGQHRRSAVTGPQLQARLDAIHVSQRAFARMVGLTAESVNRACNSQNRLPISMAIALQHVEMIYGVQALLDSEPERIGRRRLRAVLRKAQAPVTAPTRRKRSPSKPKAPAPPVQAPPIATFPPAPKGFHYAWLGHTMILVPHKPMPEGII